MRPESGEVNEDRVQALSWAIAEAQLDAAETGDEVEIVGCVGPPWCSLEGDEARRDMDTCPLCDRFVVDKDGTFVLNKSKNITSWGVS